LTKVLIRNDQKFDLNFTVTDSAGTVLSLSDVTTVVFKMKALNATENKVEKACTVDVAGSGTCHVNLVAADMDTSGNYRAEVELTYTDSKVVTADLEDIYIKDDNAN